MQLLFCHNGPLFTDGNGRFFGIGHNDDTFSRYYRLGDSLTALIRVRRAAPETLSAGLSPITVSPFSVISVPDFLSPKHFFLRARAKKVIRDAVEKADFLIIRMPGGISALAASYAEKLGKPYLVEAVSCPWDCYFHHSFLGKFYAPFARFQMRKVLRKAPYVIYVTKEFLQMRYPTRGKAFALSDASVKVPSMDILQNRLDRIRKNEKPIILGTAGGIGVPYKGQADVIRALGLLRKEGFTHFRYELAGDGNPERLRRLAEKCGVSENVIFRGCLPHRDIFDWLDSLSLYIQPSRAEALSRALIEAQSRALPIIASDVGGNGELLPRSVLFGRRHRAEAIALLLKAFTPERMMTCAAENLKTASDYCEDILAEKRLAFYELIRKECGF